MFKRLKNFSEWSLTASKSGILSKVGGRKYRHLQMAIFLFHKGTNLHLQNWLSQTWWYGASSAEVPTELRSPVFSPVFYLLDFKARLDGTLSSLVGGNPAYGRNQMVFIVPCNPSHSKPFCDSTISTFLHSKYFWEFLQLLLSSFDHVKAPLHLLGIAT